MTDEKKTKKKRKKTEEKKKKKKKTKEEEKEKEEEKKKRSSILPHFILPSVPRSTSQPLCFQPTRRQNIHSDKELGLFHDVCRRSKICNSHFVLKTFPGGHFITKQTWDKPAKVTGLQE